ncbi:MAG TPA: hypothetical protein VK841_20695 [Polyangiaceae bacterium]|nr:hypothetical protein [Polyangiaceae bacterium]
MPAPGVLFGSAHMATADQHGGSALDRILLRVGPEGTEVEMPLHERDRYKGILAREIRPNEEALDAAYEKYAPSNPFLPITHFVDHATMGPEALVALGLGGHVGAWIARHEVRTYTPPSTGIDLDTNWTAALGRAECHGDWLMQLAHELRVHHFEDVLARWVPRFVHEVGSWMFHGLIRTAHAVRALEHRDTPARRGELARGLALWATGVKTPPPGRGDPIESGALARDILQLARAGAAAFVKDPSIPAVHWVTGPMAYLLIAHHVDPRLHPVAVASFARTHARVLEDFGDAKRKAEAAPIPRLDEAQLERLAKEGDAHPIKLTEAALRAYDRTDDDLFLRAAGRMQDTTAVGRALRTARRLIVGQLHRRHPAI